MFVARSFGQAIQPMVIWTNIIWARFGIEELNNWQNGNANHNHQYRQLQVEQVGIYQSNSLAGSYMTIIYTLIVNKPCRSLKWCLIKWHIVQKWRRYNSFSQYFYLSNMFWVTRFFLEYSRIQQTTSNIQDYIMLIMLINAAISILWYYVNSKGMYVWNIYYF